MKRRAALGDLRYKFFYFPSKFVPHGLIFLHHFLSTILQTHATITRRGEEAWPEHNSSIDFCRRNVPERFIYAYVGLTLGKICWFLTTGVPRTLCYCKGTLQG